jgi:stress responsive alpha/beta barrel protein
VAGAVQHIVLFKFPSGLTPEDEADMFEQVRRWPETIPGFTGLRLGRDVAGRSAGYDYLLLTEFETEEAHQAYYSAEAHKAFSEWVFSRDCQVIRVDYPLDDTTLILG